MDELIRVHFEDKSMTLVPKLLPNLLATEPVAGDPHFLDLLYEVKQKIHRMVPQADWSIKPVGAAEKAHIIKSNRRAAEKQALTDACKALPNHLWETLFDKVISHLAMQHMLDDDDVVLAIENNRSL
jgi:hypothetical protein